MNKNLILSVILCFLMTGVVFAQSSGKRSGSSSRSSGSYSKNSKADRELASAKAKLVRQMTRNDLEAVTLNRDQKKSLMSMVDQKYPDMVQIDNQIARSIPTDQVKALQRAFRNAKKDGSSEVEAMSMSMEKIGLPEMVQEKVLMMNQSKEEIRVAILLSIAETFDEEQHEAFSASLAAKEKMMEMSSKEEMADKEMSGEKEMTEKEMTEKEMSDKEMSDKEMSSKEEMMDKEMDGEKKVSTIEKTMDREMTAAK